MHNDDTQPIPQNWSRLHYAPTATMPRYIKRDRTATIAFRTGLIGLCLSWLPGIGLILGILGIVFGSLSFRRSPRGKAGLICGILAVAVFIAFMAAFWPHATDTVLKSTTVKFSQ